MTGIDPFALLDERRQRREQERMQIMKRLAQINVEGEEDEVARKVLTRIYPDGPDKVSPPKAGAPETDANTSELKQTNSAGMTASEACLEVVKGAYPNGLTTQQVVSKLFLRFRSQATSNTVRVSMRRHRGRGKANYLNGQWFYVPHSERRETPLLLPANGAANGGAHK